VYSGNSIPPIAQNAIELSSAKNSGGSSIIYLENSFKCPLNSLQIRASVKIFIIEIMSPNDEEKIETSANLILVKGAVMIVHKKFVYPSTYSPLLYTRPWPFIKFLP
jgi:hypothetical protein